MDLGNGVEIKFGNFTPEQLQTAATEIIEAAQGRGIELPLFAGTSILHSAVEDLTEGSSVEADQSLEAQPKVEHLSVFRELNEEQQEKAVTLMTAMAEKFGVNFEDFSVVKSVGEDGGDCYTVVYAATTGIDIGDPEKDSDSKRSWESILSEEAEDAFIIELDGQSVDTRTGMTESVYRAFIAEAKSQGISPLPDSPALSDQNDDNWPSTWLTGQLEVWGNGGLDASVDKDGQILVVWRNPKNDYRSRLFRPAVKL